ncbi:MAG: benzoate/toluate 1,2-dioxygenase alpha subunit [Halioglobus sp.]
MVTPVSVNETIIESWTFRLVGAPDNMLQRTLRYSRLINSPASMVGPDDLDCYVRIQKSAEAGAIEWIDMHRHYGREVPGDGVSTAPGTSDFALRNQYLAWLDYMTDAGSDQ